MPQNRGGSAEKHQSSARLDVPDPLPQLDDYTSRKNDVGMFLYVGIFWIACPFAILACLSVTGLRPLGFVLLVAWGFFAVPRMLEGIALFVFLPAMICIGLIKGVIRQFK